MTSGHTTPLNRRLSKVTNNCLIDKPNGHLSIFVFFGATSAMDDANFLSETFSLLNCPNSIVSWFASCVYLSVIHCLGFYKGTQNSQTERTIFLCRYISPMSSFKMNASRWHGCQSKDSVPSLNAPSLSVLNLSAHHKSVRQC